MLYGSWVLEWQCQSCGDHSVADSRRTCFHSHVRMFTPSTSKGEHLVGGRSEAVLSRQIISFFFLPSTNQSSLFCLSCESLKPSQRLREKKTQQKAQGNVANPSNEARQPVVVQPHCLSYSTASSHFIFSLNGAGEKGSNEGRGEFKDGKGKCD